LRLPMLMILPGLKLSGNAWPSWNLSTYFVSDIVTSLPVTVAEACGVSMPNGYRKTAPNPKFRCTGMNICARACIHCNAPYTIRTE